MLDVMYRCGRYRQTKFHAFMNGVKLSDMKELPMFDKEQKWSALEEFVLMATLLKFSYGNWSRVSDNLKKICKKTFTPEECQQHYSDIYLEGEVGKEMAVNQIVPLKSSLVDHSFDELDEFLMTSDVDAWINVPHCFLNDVGYMPLREDFEMDYFPAAEILLKQISFDNCDDFDKKANLLILDTYRSKVKERLMLKKKVKAVRAVQHYYAAFKEHCDKEECESEWSATSTLMDLLPEPICIDTDDICLFKFEASSENDYKLSNDKRSNDKNTFSLNLYPWAPYLTIDEAKLCLELRLRPIYYLYYKAFLMDKDGEKQQERSNNEMNKWETLKVKRENDNHKENDSKEFILKIKKNNCTEKNDENHQYTMKMKRSYYEIIEDTEEINQSCPKRRKENWNLDCSEQDNFDEDNKSDIEYDEERYIVIDDDDDEEVSIKNDEQSNSVEIKFDKGESVIENQNIDKSTYMEIKNNDEKRSIIKDDDEQMSHMETESDEVKSGTEIEGNELKSNFTKEISMEINNKNLIPFGMTVQECVKIIEFMMKAGYIRTPDLLNYILKQEIGS